MPSWQPPYNEKNVVHLTILDQNGAETDFRGPKVTPIGAGWTKRCGTMCGTPEQAISGHKKIERVGRGGRGGQYLPQKWPKFGFGALQRPPIGSRTTGLDPKCSPQLPLIDLSQFQAVASFGG